MNVLREFAPQFQNHELIKALVYVDRRLINESKEQLAIAIENLAGK